MHYLDNKLTITVLLILTGYIIKFFIIKFINKKIDIESEKTLSLNNNIKNFINIILLVCIFYIWLSELQNIVLSIAAFMVAIVLATREYIQCFIGFIYITSSQPFRVGDWIQTDDTCGEVIATDWAKVTLLEVNSNYSYTGRTLFIPNNIIITTTVKNLNFFKRYINHQFSIIMDSPFNPYLIKSDLTDEIKNMCSEFRDVAERYNSIIERKLEVNIAGPDAIISISTTELGRIKTTFTIFCPTKQALELESKITESFFKLAELKKTKD